MTRYSCLPSVYSDLDKLLGQYSLFCAVLSYLHLLAYSVGPVDM